MTEKLMEYTNLTQVLVIITFLTVCIKFDRKNPVHRVLLAIIAVSLLNEIVTYLLLILKGNTSIVYTVNVAVHHGLWVYLLSKIAQIRELILYSLAGFIAFAVFNLTLLEGHLAFNFNTFIAGALLYVVLFIIESFRQLKNENLFFFTHRNYLLLCAPLLLFTCLSFVFGFKSAELSRTVVFGDIPLYTAIGYFSNLFYYILINLYLFRPKIHSNGI